MWNKITTKIFAVSLVLVLLVAAQQAQAAMLDVWSDPFSKGEIGYLALKDIGLGTRDPRAIVAGVVQIALGFLGVLAISLLIYGGWLWMSANGNDSQITKAKNIIRNAAIGLLIVLSAFAVSLYVVRAWIGVTGAESGTLAGGCQDGVSRACGCGGLQVCSGQAWGDCVGSDCVAGDGTEQYCDGNLLTQTCDADSSICKLGQFCDPASCRCKAGGGVGAKCDGSETDGGCQADKQKCGAYLTCNPDSCLCAGGPVIEAISPVGGFCDGDRNKACMSEEDCTGLTPSSCNRRSPNGAVGNLITIRGRYFGDYDAAKSKVYINGVEAPLASTVNSECQGVWSDSQIVVVIPAGANTGSLKVESAAGSDESGDERGPKLNDLEVNNLNRPGLCRLSKEQGAFNEPLSYYGIGLEGAAAFFGSLGQNVQSNNSLFKDLSGEARVPNIEAKDTTTFVLRANKSASNFLSFNKLADQDSGPLIVSFEPASGAAGQYVTINGSGFGSTKGNSSVLFGNKEAVYAFPAVCADSVWSGGQLVVKVPSGLADGDYDLSVRVGEQSAVAGTKFKLDSKAKLLPGLCKMEPSLGRPGDELSVWGENFGPKNNQAKLRFFDNIERSAANKICLGGNEDGQSCQADGDCSSKQCVSELLYWGTDKAAIDPRPDKATTKIPPQALSGPVRLIKGQDGLESNALNLTIGECNEDGQCGAGNICCAAETPMAGTCQTDASACYGAGDTCVFEWQFSTGQNGSCPVSRPNLCQDGRCCKGPCVLNKDTGLTTCIDDDSCASLGDGDCTESLTCPNSPGNCSSGPDKVLTGGTCNCALLGLPGGEFDNNTNRCVDKNSSCSLPKTVNDVNGQELTAWCAPYQGTNRWQFASKQTCPQGWTRGLSGSNLCVNLLETCSTCGKGNVCAEIEGQGRCASAYPVCPSNFSCQAGACTKSQSNCECCCDENQNNADGTNPACCAPLTCGNECGAKENFGLCGGCANVGSTQAEHDAACNCQGHAGKFCDASVPGGVCRDCGQIGDPNQCSLHEACCVDGKKGQACVGVKGARVFDQDIAFCAYYSCGDDCQAPAKTGEFSDPTQCQDNCEVSCDASTELPGCQADAGLCPPDKPICGADCICKADSKDPGSVCATPQGSCTLFCGNIYNCRGELGCSGAGCAGQPDENTCRCCCDPSKQGSDAGAPDFDKCKLVGKGSLSCKANAEPCSGEQRGLCCGCQADSECGAPDEVGCGSDSCCRPRPGIQTMLPADNQTEVCRNTVIRAEFSEVMDGNSVNGNVLLIGDFGDSLCPENSSLLAAADLPDQGNWLVRLWRKFRAWTGQLLGQEASAADGHNFCLISASPSIVEFGDGKNKKSWVNLSFNTALNANTEYYVIVKGDENLSSQAGVLSAKKIGFKGNNLAERTEFNGISFNNAQIWNFRTGNDVCALEQVKLNPSQHLFAKPQAEYVFAAQALDARGSQLAPISGYNWDWDWSSDDPKIADIKSSQAETAVVAAGQQADAQTFIWAAARILVDEINPISTAGQVKSGKAMAITFFCENPWPTVTDPNAWPVLWRDADDNCVCFEQSTGKQRACQPGECIDNKFSLYYCRDKGGPGTKDDLPALKEDLTIRGTYQYIYQDRWFEVLKDYYLFRSRLPQAPQELKAELTDSEQGGEVRLSWSAVDYAARYKVYYGAASGAYDGFLEIKGAGAVIGRLTNNKTYYFAVTAVSEEGAESAYSQEQAIEVKDIKAPEAPQAFQGQVETKNKRINLSWQKAGGNPTEFILEYGPNPNPAVKAKVGLKTSYQLPALNNLDVQDYYVRLSAVDSGGNLSPAVSLKCAKGCSGSCACTPQ